MHRPCSRAQTLTAQGLENIGGATRCGIGDFPGSRAHTDAQQHSLSGPIAIRAIFGPATSDKSSSGSPMAGKHLPGVQSALLEYDAVRETGTLKSGSLLMRT